MRTIDIIMAKRFGKGKKGMVIGWPWMMGTAGGGGTETTVTGVSPLLLAAALHKPLKSLTQYGLCTQADTPTPSVPVPLMCNNGALKMVDDELPAGYKRLTGIRFDGDTWYETGESMTGADDVTMTLDNTAGQGQNVFGSYNGTASGSKNFSLFIYGNGVTSNSYFRYGEQLLRPRFGTGERTITFGQSGTDGFATDASATPDTFETPANAYIGMLPNSTSPAYTGDIKGNITVGARLKWIPVERVSDNAIGYYEAVKGAFIAPSGTGTPTSLGYDGSHYSLAVVGTDEVIYLYGKNLDGDNLDHIGFTSTGGASTSETFVGTGRILPCNAGEKYTISFGGFTTSGISGIFVNTWKTDGTFNLRQAISSSGTTTYQIPAGVNRVNFTLYKTGGATIDSGAWMQVQYGATATDYVPYVAPQTASAVDLFGVGSNTDTQDIVSGTISRKCGVYVVTGQEEDWARYNAYKYTLVIPNLKTTYKTAADGEKLLMSTHFIETTSTDTYRMWKQGTSSSKVWFSVPSLAEDTVDAMKAFAAAQYAAGTPVIVLYPLATETTESVTPHALHTNAGDNGISVEANVSPIQLEAVYMKGE